ncbi:MAG: metal ABC transporter substrate-binding protein [Intrasporangium sp.]|uniref:metal ABC transporter substrate-binding protein n=1 Tax=Intrasporangium sp. TaxID=1925024 RepID=UPI00264797F3|nr:metal ABC transporter substrate-binding protein [Intrasporangium sp.]MDN5796563.1 metal ABC transporter substrate-binding protein [Intrasporangium sp.]
MTPARLVAAALAAAALGVLASCTSSTAATEAGAGAESTGAQPLTVTTSFYPLEFVVQQVAGERAHVTSLTRPGAEPHEVELSARQVVGLRKADLFVYESGFQPAVDDAMDLLERKRVLDVTPVADLTPAADLTLGSGTGENTQGVGGHAHDHDHAMDPHFWLDPERYATVAEAIGTRLSQLDPAHEADYAAGTRTFVHRLDTLDKEFRAGLAHCALTDLVTSHAAFGYLAHRYGLVQHGITGLNPEAEPSAGALADLAHLVRTDGVTTIYRETLVEPHYAQVIAAETGARVAVLDPVEGITSTSAGSDYFAVMRANLATLEQGQECS